MVSSNLIFKFKNDRKDRPMWVIIDPPVIDFQLDPDEEMKLIIVGYRDAVVDVSDILDIRYSVDCINVDVNHNFQLVAIFKDEEIVIWRGSS